MYRHGHTCLLGEAKNVVHENVWKKNCLIVCLGDYLMGVELSG